MKFQVGRSKKLATQALVLSGASAASHVYGLIDQGFISKISEAFLRTHYYSELAVLIFIIFGRVGGQSLLVSYSKAVDDQERSKYVTGALQFTGLINIVIWLSLGLTLFLVRDQFDSHSLGYFAAIGSAGFFLGLNLIQKFVLIARAKRAVLLKAEVAGNLLNLAGNFAAFTLLTNKNHQLIGIGLSTLVTQIFLFTFFTFQNLSFLRPINQVGVFFQRAKHLLAGEGLSLGLLTLSPYLAGLIFEITGHTDLFISYNYSLKWSYFLAMPILSLTMLGTIELSKSLGQPNHQKQTSLDLIVAALAVSGIPSLFVALAIYILGDRLPIPQVANLAMAAAIISLNLIYTFSVPLVARARALEKPQVIGYVEILIGLCLRIPLFWLALTAIGSDHLISGILLILYVTEILRLAGTYFMVRKVDQSEQKDAPT